MDLSEKMQLAIKYHQAGRLAKAKQLYKEIIAEAPGNVNANHLLGLIEYLNKNYKEAEEYIQRAISEAPGFAEAQFNLGVVVQDSGHWKKALECYEKTLAIKPDYAPAYNNMGSMFMAAGQNKKAYIAFQQAIEKHPGYAEAHNNLGILFHKEKRLKEAFHCFRTAIDSEKESDRYWGNFADCLTGASFGFYDDQLEPYILQMLDLNVVSPNLVARPIVSMVKHHPAFQRAEKLLADISARGKSSLYREVIACLLEIPLLLKIMTLSPLYDVQLEKILTTVRKYLLNDLLVDKSRAPLIAALSAQCFINGYVFFETSDESDQVDLLEERIKFGLTAHGRMLTNEIMILSAYRSLSQFKWAETISTKLSGSYLRQVIRIQVTEVLEEARICETILPMTPIINEISKRVQKQYEEHPYPRWIRAGIGFKPLWVQKLSAPAKGHGGIDLSAIPEAPEILVAGCGTGQHALVAASRFLKCRVLGVDLSRKSLAYAIRKTRELGISNIEYKQADILNLGTLKKQFDIIESVGVLHHMDDPMSGWAVLAELLKPGGLMLIGLYSELGRRAVVAARDAIEKRRIKAEPDDIRRFRRDLMEGRFSPEVKEIVERRDFYSMSECRDLLFHVQEHRFGLIEIETLLKKLGLEFLGFESLQESVKKRFDRIYPKKDSVRSLHLWHEFEKEYPSSFNSMYQFWVQKGQDPQ